MLLRLFQLRFLPTSVDLALLVLRLWFGLSLIGLHGWGKLTTYSARAHQFPDPYGLGSPVSLALATFAEVVCSLLVALGLCTRFGALVCGFNMATAFVTAHGARLTGQGNGELAFMYLGAFVTLLLAGGGRYSLDAKMGGR